MSAPEQPVPAQPGWWVRSNRRVGVASGSYGWMLAGNTGGATLNVTANLTAAGRVPYGAVSGDAPLAVTATLNATGTVTPTLTVVGVNTNASGGSCTIPTHQAGDLIVVAAYSATSSYPLVDAPTAGGTVPQFTYMNHTSGTHSQEMTTGYAVATASNHTSGTWSLATSVAVAVLRGQHSTPIGGNACDVMGYNKNDVTAPAVTLTRSDGTSVILHFFARPSNAGFTAWGDAPTGYTNRSSALDGDGICVDTKNVTTTDGAVTHPTTTQSTYTGTSGATVEVRQW